MAQFPTKVLANIGAASPNAGGNQGYTSPAYVFTYFEFGTPAARTSIPFGAVPCVGTVIGVSSGIGTTGTAITYAHKKIDLLTQTVTALTSTSAVITSSATGPAVTNTIAWNGQAATVTHGQNGGVVATGITDAVLSAVSGARQVAQGDMVGITTSGTFTSGVGLFATITVREDEGAQ